MVTAYVSGPSLDRAVAERGPLPADALRGLGAGLAEGLRAIHACGLVHRDLKPGNVLLADDGPRIIDFGIARATCVGEAMTTAGAVLGTFLFTSPEQLHGLRALVAACLAKDQANRPTVADVLRSLGDGDDGGHGVWSPPATQVDAGRQEAAGPSGASSGWAVHDRPTAAAPHRPGTPVGPPGPVSPPPGHAAPPPGRAAPHSPGAAPGTPWAAGGPPGAPEPGLPRPPAPRRDAPVVRR